MRFAPAQVTPNLPVCVMTHRAVLAVVLSGFLLLGCDSSFTRPKRETPDALAAVSVLNPDADRQALLLTEVATPQPLQDDLFLVQDATVQIGGTTLDNRPADSVEFPRYLPRDANYRTDALDVRPGRTYTMTAETGKYRLTGTVAVPDTFIGRAEGHRLIWTESTGAARYQVRVEDAADTSFEFENEYTVTDTTVRVETNTLSGAVDTLVSGRYYVEIAAQDSQLTAFMRGTTDRAGIEDGYGLFGATTKVSGTVSLGETKKEKEAALTPPIGP